MNKDEDVTKVIFRVFTDGYSKDEVIALFPELPGDSNPLTCLSYMHIGQHGTAGYLYVLDITTPATPEQYKDLFEELESIGYNLEVCKKQTYAMHLNKIKILQGV